MKKKRPVLVTTRYRGVFFGYEKKPLSRGKITLTEARNCLYWSADVRGFLGLAATGPSDGCRIGPAVSVLTLVEVTSVADVNPEAEKRWSAAPWA